MYVCVCDMLPFSLLPSLSLFKVIQETAYTRISLIYDPTFMDYGGADFGGWVAALREVRLTFYTVAGVRESMTAREITDTLNVSLLGVNQRGYARFESWKEEIKKGP